MADKQDPKEVRVSIRMGMMGGKCGCVTCKTGGGQGMPPKSFWMGQRNKHNRSYGKFKKK